ncbi:MAG: 2-C-methyl-D-erythritol 4-phosphate cytidylyltransferase [bacterium]|nr:2-C-methyl-D-erythritol 4-phosphate cytidylyltransferase [bacterium]
MSKFAVILPAAGKSSRFQDPYYKKPFATLAGRAVWLHAAEKFANRKDVCQTIVVISPDDRETFNDKFGGNTAMMGIDIVAGGAERADSVGNALAVLKDDVEYIAVHDAARPLISELWIDAVFEAAQSSGAAILAAPVAGTLKRVGADSQIEETVSRENLWEAQTPQVFRRDILETAYAQRDGFVATDEAQLVERTGNPVTVVECSKMNFKITTQDDLRLAELTINAIPRPKLDTPDHPFRDDNLWR